MFINLMETKTGVEMALSHELVSPKCSNGAVFHGSYSLDGHDDTSANAIVNVMLHSFAKQPPAKAIAGLKGALKDLVVTNSGT